MLIFSAEHFIWHALPFLAALVSAPYFVWFEILFKLGYRPQLYKEMQIEVNKDIAEFRARKEGKKN